MVKNCSIDTQGRSAEKRLETGLNHLTIIIIIYYYYNYLLQTRNNYNYFPVSLNINRQPLN